jgi:hypothetical protein
MSIQFSTKTAQGIVKILVLLAVVLGGTGLLITPAQLARASHLSEGVWANSVNACAIDEADLREYAFNLNRLNLKIGIAGTITARCNVENLPINPPIGDTALQLIYRDQDGAGVAYRVVAKLQQISNTGSLVTLATVDSNSDTCPGASPSFQSCFKIFSQDLNFDNNAYFVEVTVFRNDAVQSPAAAIVRITGIFVNPP